MTLSPVLETLGYSFMRETKIETLTIPKTIKTTDYYGTSSSPTIGVFSGINASFLNEVIFEEGLTFLPSYMFANATSVKTVVIPESLTGIGICAFYGATALTNVRTKDEVTTGVSLTKTQVKSIGNYAFSGCVEITSMSLSPVLETLGYYFISSTKIETLTIPKTIKTTDYYGTSSSPTSGVFSGINTSFLNEVIFEEGLTFLPSYMFANATSVKTVVIPESLTGIGISAFNGATALTNVRTKDEVTTGVSLAKTQIKNLGDYAFRGCTSIPSITLSPVIEGLGYCFIQGVRIPSISIPGTLKSAVKSTSYGVFSGIGAGYLTEVTFEEGLTTIPTNMFFGSTTITSVILPKSLTTIGDSMFAGMTTLKSVKGPDADVADISIKNTDIKTIGNLAFSGCSNINTITLPATLENLEDGLTAVPARMFYNANTIVDVILPDTVEKIGDYAFSGASSLVNMNSGMQDGVVIPGKVTQIPSTAFTNCSSIKSMTIPNTVTDLYGNMFNNIPNLVINCAENSKAHQVAVSYQINVNLIPESTDSPDIHLSVPGETAKDEIPVFGTVPAGKTTTVDIYDGSKLIKTVDLSAKGKFSTYVKLDNPVDGSTHKLTAKSGKYVSNIADVLYSTSSPVVSEFIMLHAGIEHDVLEYLGTGKRPVINHLPSQAFTFTIKISNPEKIAGLSVLSTNDADIKELKAVYDSNKGVWVAAGWFDPANPKYLPGALNVTYALKDDDFSAEGLSEKDLQWETLYNEYLKETSEAFPDAADVTDELEIYKIVGSYSFTAAMNEKKVLTGQTTLRNIIIDGVSVEVKNVTPEQLITAGFVKDSVNNKYIRLSSEFNGRIYIEKIEVFDEKSRELKYAYAGYLLTEATGLSDNDRLFSAHAIVSDISDNVGLNGKNVSLNDVERRVKNAGLPGTVKSEVLSNIKKARIANSLFYLWKITDTDTLDIPELSDKAFWKTAANISLNMIMDDCAEALGEYDLTEILGITGLDEAYTRWTDKVDGFVYEGVYPNRVSGAKITLYYRTNTWGDGEVWNSGDYDQNNPFLSNKDGKFVWDAPEGYYWRVKVEKDGYDEALSEWVHSSELKANISVGLIDKTAPTVKTVNVYKDGADITFDKYIDVSTLNAENFVVKNNNQTVNVTPIINAKFSAPNEANNYYAKSVTLKFPTELSGNVNVTVKSDVKSYANIQLDSDYVINNVVEIKTDSLKAKKTVAVKYGENSKIVILTAPAQNAADKKLVLTSTNPNFDIPEFLSVDSNGEAVLDISGDIIGETTVTATLENTALSSTIYIVSGIGVEAFVSVGSDNLGDINYDGNIDTADVINLLRYSVGASGDFVRDNADINLDEIVDNRDAILLLRKLAYS